MCYLLNAYIYNIYINVYYVYISIKYIRHLLTAGVSHPARLPLVVLVALAEIAEVLEVQCGEPRPQSGAATCVEWHVFFTVGNMGKQNNQSHVYNFSEDLSPKYKLKLLSFELDNGHPLMCIQPIQEKRALRRTEQQIYSELEPSKA